MRQLQLGQPVGAPPRTTSTARSHKRKVVRSCRRPLCQPAGIPGVKLLVNGCALLDARKPAQPCFQESRVRRAGNTFKHAHPVSPMLLACVSY